MPSWALQCAMQSTCVEWSWNGSMRNQLTLSMWFHPLFFAPNLVTRASQTSIRTWTLLEYHSKGEINDNTAENNGMGLCIQRKLERAGRTVGAQSSNEAEQKCSLNKSLHRSFKFWDIIMITYGFWPWVQGCRCCKWEWSTAMFLQYFWWYCQESLRRC